MSTRAAATAAITLTAILALAGCAGTTTGTEQTPAASRDTTAVAADANMADVMFTTMMIPHHEQAVEMADMVLAKDGIDEKVIALAEQIKAAQDPEITTMRGWLDAWDAPAPSGMGDMGDGMMSGTDMAALDAATGADASRLFLEQMVQHHEGAIDMASTEVDAGQNADAIALAGQIIDGQTAEIATMRDILATL